MHIPVIPNTFLTQVVENPNVFCSQSENSAKAFFAMHDAIKGSAVNTPFCNEITDIHEYEDKQQ